VCRTLPKLRRIFSARIFETSVLKAFVLMHEGESPRSSEVINLQRTLGEAAAAELVMQSSSNCSAADCSMATWA